MVKCFIFIVTLPCHISILTLENQTQKNLFWPLDHCQLCFSDCLFLTKVSSTISPSHILPIFFLLSFCSLQWCVLGVSIVDQDICHRECLWFRYCGEQALLAFWFLSDGCLHFCRLYFFTFFSFFYPCFSCQVSQGWSWWFWWFRRVDHNSELFEANRTAAQIKQCYSTKVVLVP